MGYDIVRDAVAAKVEHEGREYVTVAFRIADSNLWNENGMSESWNMLVPGLQWEVMQDAVKLSAACESGTLKWGHGRGRNILPETFIHKVREVVRRAPVSPNLWTRIPDASGFWVRWPLEEAEWKRRRFEEAKEKGLVTEIREAKGIRGEALLEVRFTGFPASVAFAAENRGKAHLWCF